MVGEAAGAAPIGAPEYLESGAVLTQRGARLLGPEVAQHDRFVELLGWSGLTADRHAAVIASSAFGPLTAALRRAEAYHHDLETLVPTHRRPSWN